MPVIFTAGRVFRDAPLHPEGVVLADQLDAVGMPIVVETRRQRERRLAQNRRIRVWAFVALLAAMGAAWMWVAIRPDPKQQTVEVKP